MIVYRGGPDGLVTLLPYLGKLGQSQRGTLTGHVLWRVERFDVLADRLCEKRKGRFVGT